MNEALHFNLLSFLPGDILVKSRSIAPPWRTASRHVRRFWIGI
jgi:hypothetical protein